MNFLIIALLSILLAEILLTPRFDYDTLNNQLFLWYRIPSTNRRNFIKLF